MQMQPPRSIVQTPRPDACSATPPVSTTCTEIWLASLFLNIFTAYLFSVGKTATEQVAKTAKQLKETVEEKVGLKT